MSNQRPKTAACWYHNRDALNKKKVTEFVKGGIFLILHVIIRNICFGEYSFEINVVDALGEIDFGLCFGVLFIGDGRVDFTDFGLGSLFEEVFVTAVVVDLAFAEVVESQFLPFGLEFLDNF